MLAAMLALLVAGGQADDRTAIALERCLASPTAAPRAVPEEDPDADSQTEAPPVENVTGAAACYDDARRSYDRRIVRTYRSLLKKADPAAAEWLAQTSQAWIAYREKATSPADVAAAARDHALWLEGLAAR